MNEQDEEIVPEDESEGGGAAALSRLREKLAQCVKEKQEYLDGWQRMRADFANTKRDEEKRRKDLVEAARFDIIGELVPTLDSFDLAITSRDSDNGKEGVENIRNQLLSVLKRAGVTPFDPLGDPFDPGKHEPMQNVPVSEKEKDNTVIEVLQRGYRTEGRVVRPAKVTIGHYEDK